MNTFSSTDPTNYVEPAQAAGESVLGGPAALILIVVKDKKNNDQFRLPSVVREYVELKAREAA
jgi:hypothetical protein